MAGIFIAHRHVGKQFTQLAKWLGVHFKCKHMETDAFAKHAVCTQRENYAILMDFILLPTQMQYAVVLNLVLGSIQL